jgi:hypothetical protein
MPGELANPFSHGEKNKPLQSRYMTISTDDFAQFIDMMKFDVGDTET